MEVFGACVLISERPGSAPNYLEHIKAGKLRSAAERGHPGLGKDLDRLGKIVHPGSGAILGGFKVTSAADRTVEIRFGLHAPGAEEGREGFTVLANMARLISERLVTLASLPEILSAGRHLLGRYGVDS